MRQFIKSTLVIASHNQGKVVEIRDLLRPFQINVHSAGEYNLEEPEETGATFIENAIIKAGTVANEVGVTSLADDSGLVIPALDGAPGIYSARWAGENKDFAVAMERITSELAKKGVDPEGVPAYFVCALCMAWPDGHFETLEGRCEGTLTFPPRGNHGFGYDPIFIPQGYDKTFAELDSSIKQTISHRAKAFKQLVEACLSEAA